ncbi:Uncharacterised protein [BD1-7 clade bacterium]|uniref:Uncharacterized protein n=1 Tax=BD1-7 clade bacterium TaxID=2029982 RepID=A0A5S9QGQ2_9GAMM|nr:Uncharacterised protein [BD1-7 clade bacterium]CAA0117228.1 Uncharacterised protein [BD1-7 clade bacterium]
MFKYAPSTQKQIIEIENSKLTVWQLHAHQAKSAIVIAIGKGAQGHACFVAPCSIAHFCPDGQRMSSNTRTLVVESHRLPVFDHRERGQSTVNYALAGLDDEWIADSGSLIKSRLYRTPFIYRDSPALVFVHYSATQNDFETIVDLVIKQLGVEHVIGHFSRCGDDQVDYIPPHLMRQRIRSKDLNHF